MGIKHNYTSADGFPIKVLRNRELLESIHKYGTIPPIHVQLIPTNQCNMDCEFCSCSGEDRSKEMLMQDLSFIAAEMYRLGTQAVTITGGGEPMMHPKINDIVKMLFSYGIDVGIVSNGSLLHNLDTDGEVTWCRISNGDHREFTDKYKSKLSAAVWKNKNIDWAFSHVVSSKPNIKEIVNVINFANDHDFTHVRLVADLMDPEKSDLSKVKDELEKIGTDISRVIFQPRVSPPRGGDCYICYLKPVIAADLKVFACCGAQYAIDGRERKLQNELYIGEATNLDAILSDSREPLDGSICDRCYYTGYNDLLGKMLTKTKHERFV